MKLTIEIEPGETIEDACNYAQDIADKCQWPVEFEFNSVLCIAQPGGDPAALYERQQQAQHTKPTVYSDGRPI
jgi:hypothetical protein